MLNYFTEQNQMKNKLIYSTSCSITVAEVEIIVEESLLVALANAQQQKQLNS